MGNAFESGSRRQPVFDCHRRLAAPRHGKGPVALIKLKR